MPIEFIQAGAREFAAELRAAATRAPAEAHTEVAKSAGRLEADMKARAPVRTGALRDGIGTDFDEDGLGAAVGPTAPYAHLVEFGTAHMQPKPFVRPAEDAEEPRFAAAVDAMSRRLLP